MSPESVILADLYDLWTAKNAKPYPRPWNRPKPTTVGTPLTVAEYRERLRELAEADEDRLLMSVSTDGLMGTGGHHQGNDPANQGPAEQQVDPEDGAGV